MVVEGEGGIAHDIPAAGGDFDDFGLGIEEVDGDGLEGVAASGDPLVDRAWRSGITVGAGFEDAEGRAPGGIAGGGFVFVIETVQEPVLKEGRA
jgi:hypothetical protein